MLECVVFILFLDTLTNIFQLFKYLLLCFRGKKQYEPPSFMTIGVAIDQLLEVEQLRGESGNFLDLFIFYYYFFNIEKRS